METLTLYGFGFSDRSAKVRWLAHELDIPLNEIRVQYGSQRLPEYKALNPFGVVPTAIWKGVTLRESGAICTYIAEQFPESELIIGGSGQEQADFYRNSRKTSPFMAGMNSADTAKCPGYLLTTQVSAVVRCIAE